MSTIMSQPSVSGLAKLLLLGLAVSATSLLAALVFVVFILVPEDVRSATLRGTPFQWDTVVNATGIDNPAGMPLPDITGRKP
ncbi:hypothetical protein [Methylocaldum sp.]|uniref:hypothetical protein n=1 Tax=Methylocaldum sp. TaxID=1969727 RepID=UPI002D3830A7|nr:hypothetical protein [Methylocaldum sp.]HYE33891.1 hypothetical protein [Methylocaldum sp.]